MNIGTRLAVIGTMAAAMAPPRHPDDAPESYSPLRYPGDGCRPKSQYELDRARSLAEKIRIVFPANGVPTGPKPKSRTRAQMARHSRKVNRRHR